MPLADLARVTTETLAPHRPSYIRLPLGWPGEYCRFEHPLDYIGFDGGGGIGSGPGMAVGAALALRGGDRLPVAVLGDGDYLMGVTALWTGVHYRVPVLIVVANNESFFNDELHQERMARAARPARGESLDRLAHERSGDGSRRTRARPGRQGLRPRAHARTRSPPRSRRASPTCAAGAVVVIDARVAPEYSRAVSVVADAPHPGDAEADDRACPTPPHAPPTRACRGIAVSTTAARGTRRRAAARSRSSARRRARRSAPRSTPRPTTSIAPSPRRERRFPPGATRRRRSGRRRSARRVAILLEHADELAWLEALDTGNPFQAMRFDVEISAGYMEYFAGLVTEIKGNTIPIGAGTLNYTLREPLGVVGRIGAFNHPLLFTAGKCGAPLVAGNTLVVKPADQTPLSSLRIAELWEDVFPPGVFNVVTGGRDAGVALVAHPKVAKIGFIGSVAAGRAVMKGARATLKALTLELGGKNALIACADAAPDEVADGVVRGMNFRYVTGQSCNSTSRVYLHDAIHDATLPEIVKRVRAAQGGLAHRARHRDVVPLEPGAVRQDDELHQARRRGRRTARLRRQAPGRSRSSRTASSSSRPCSPTSPTTCASRARRSSARW